MLAINFEKRDLLESEAVAILINKGLKLDQATMQLDQAMHGLISKTIQNKDKFIGEFGQILSLTGLAQDEQVKNIIIVGVGEEEKLAEYQLEELGGKIYSQAKIAKCKYISVNLLTNISTIKEANVAALIANGALLAAYKFDKYQTKLKETEKFDLDEFNIVGQVPEEANQAFTAKKAVSMGVYLARDLVTEVPNILYPESYADKIIKTLEPIGVKVTILGEREMRELGMGALLGVGQGSERESKLVVMEYKGADDDRQPVCFVGKGVTFDTGGISLKPAAGMDSMKYDMGGSAAVVGAVQAIALRGAKTNIVGIVGLVENMPGSNAQRPGDVVKTMSGQTVEVLNTDAEGRLVLCDCITYLQENFKPAYIIDLATLTGAIIVSLASTYAGCFANDDELAEKLISSSHKANEKLWRMPLHQDYDAMLKSPIADMANIGGERGAAGSSTAAQFIGRFINEGAKWAHLDIAGMAWEKKATNAICPPGGVGFGVRLLNQFVQDHYENQ